MMERPEYKKHAGEFLGAYIYLISLYIIPVTASPGTLALSTFLRTTATAYAFEHISSPFYNDFINSDSVTLLKELLRIAASVLACFTVRLVTRENFFFIPNSRCSLEQAILSLLSLLVFDHYLQKKPQNDRFARNIRPIAVGAFLASQVYVRNPHSSGFVGSDYSGRIIYGIIMGDPSCSFSMLLWSLLILVTKTKIYL